MGQVNAPAPAKDRHRVELRTLLLTAAVTLLNAFGNLSLTWGMKHFPQAVGLSPAPYLEAFLNPFVLAGTIMLIFWLLTRMTLMSWADLSFVVPMSSFAYVLAAVLGKIFLHETVSVRRWFGTVLIFAGSALVGATSQRTNTERTAVNESNCEMDRWAA
ncbi:MAG: EamA family transporter [Bryobacteraceae bacterium]